MMWILIDFGETDLGPQPQPMIAREGKTLVTFCNRCNRVLGCAGMAFRGEGGHSPTTQRTKSQFELSCPPVGSGQSHQKHVLLRSSTKDPDHPDPGGTHVATCDAPCGRDRSDGRPRSSLSNAKRAVIPPAKRVRRHLIRQSRASSDDAVHHGLCLTPRTTARPLT
jgi:hypothetical protein